MINRPINDVAVRKVIQGLAPKHPGCIGVYSKNERRWFHCGFNGL